MGPVADIIGTSFRAGLGACERFAHRLASMREELASAAGGVAMLAPRIRAMSRMEAALRRPLRLAILGESNTGKSTLTNLLLGLSVLPTLQVANTRVPTLLRYGERTSAVAVLESGEMLPLMHDARPPATMSQVYVELTLPHLRACEIIDFPGFFDPLLGYDDVDVAAHRIDAAIWCTFSTQAWKESERSAWRRLPAHPRKYGLLAVTNMDRLREDQAAKVAARLEKVARSDFRDFVFLSSLDAQHAYDGDGVFTDEAAWQRSGAAALHEKLGHLLHDLRLDHLHKAQAFTSRMTAEALQRLST